MERIDFGTNPPNQQHNIEMVGVLTSRENKGPWVNLNFAIHQVIINDVTYRIPIDIESDPKTSLKVEVSAYKDITIDDEPTAQYNEYILDINSRWYEMRYSHFRLIGNEQVFFFKEGGRKKVYNIQKKLMHGTKNVQHINYICKVQPDRFIRDGNIYPLTAMELLKPGSETKGWKITDHEKVLQTEGKPVTPEQMMEILEVVFSGKLGEELGEEESWDLLETDPIGMELAESLSV